MARIAPALTVSLLVGAGLLAGCSTVREVQDPQLKPDGQPSRFENDDVLAYSVSQPIEAPCDKVWPLISDAEQIPKWYSMVTKVEGKVADGEKIELHSTLRPDEPFNLKVTIVEPGKKMTWEDGMPMGMFAGVRTYTLAPQGEGACLATMSEAFSGGMLGMIKDELPDFGPSFQAWAADLKKAAEAG